MARIEDKIEQLQMQIALAALCIPLTLTLAASGFGTGIAEAIKAPANLLLTLFWVLATINIIGLVLLFLRHRALCKAHPEALLTVTEPPPAATQAEAPATATKQQP